MSKETPIVAPKAAPKTRLVYECILDWKQGPIQITSLDDPRWTAVNQKAIGLHGSLLVFEGDKNIACFSKEPHEVREIFGLHAETGRYSA